MKKLRTRCGIAIYRATHVRDANCIAVHLLEPSKDELDRAIEDAEAKGFESIVTHSIFTWPRKEKSNAKANV